MLGEKGAACYQANTEIKEKKEADQIADMLLSLNQLSADVLELAQNRLSPIQKPVPAATTREEKTQPVCSPLFGQYRELIMQIQTNLMYIKEEIGRIEI